ncbi:hypothetical protein [Pseudoflavonifractor sp. AF19-9AC]|uniref:hypothetical protein n=1 Tax=Pseudoflavonifractor sp. AF19-9AC TaxID=2292244 RepID=UPI0011C37704|nr:hypothetical protein [Pseudoflavonifractor sp. AF19-9AC]
MLCTAALALILLLTGALYLKQREGNSLLGTEPAAPPGVLTGVMYSVFGGMTVRNDFFIWLSPDAIVETFYYPEEPPKGVGWHDPFEKENVPISAEQWADVEQVVLEIYPLMKPKPEPRIDLWSSLGRWLGGAKDESSSSSITLIWDTEEGEQRIKYSSPNDKRISTLVALLKELADPIGREIPPL